MTPLELKHARAPAADRAALAWLEGEQAQYKRDRSNLLRGFAWAFMFSTIFWGFVALWVAL